MGLHRFKPMPSGRRGIFWTLSGIKDAAVVEFGCMGHNLYSGSCLKQAGMYEEKGLLVIRISGESKWRRRGFRERDVILEVDGQEAGSPERWAELSCAEPGRAVVWREQGPRILSWSD